jgi:hypothetical protein
MRRALPTVPLLGRFSIVFQWLAKQKRIDCPSMTTTVEHVDFDLRRGVASNAN